MTWRILNKFVRVHALAYRLTSGLVGAYIPGVPPMLLLDHVGARTGKRRTNPLVYIRDDDNIVLVASKGGSPHHPGWYHNLMAHPETSVQIAGSRIPVRARKATDEERRRLWPTVVEVYGGYEDYQRRTDREIPLVILQPRGE